MQTCNPSCFPGHIPNTDWAKNCNITTRSGGIPYLSFFKCDPTLDFPYDPVSPSTSPWSNLDNVIWALCNGHLYITGEIIGQKPKGSFTKRRITSCAPEIVTSGSKTVTFQDYNASVEELIDFNFWDGIDKGKRFLQFGWFDCNDLWYQTDKNWDLEIDQVIEDNSEQGLSFWDGTVTIAEKSIIKPIFVEGIFDLINSFNTVDYCYS
jgi:hypothetical protein